MTIVALMRRKLAESVSNTTFTNRTFRSATELGVRSSGYGIKTFPKKVIEVTKKKNIRPNPYSNVRLNPYKW